MAYRIFTGELMSNAAFSSEEASRPALPAPADSRRPGALMRLPSPAAQGEQSGWADSAFSPASEVTTAERDGRRWRSAAGIAAVVAIGGVAVLAQVHSARVANAERVQSHALAHRLDGIVASLEALDGNRSDFSAMKKSLAEIKANAAGAHEVGGAVAQLSARVERLEKEQIGRLDKLEKDSTQQLAGLAQRLEKLDAKPPVAAKATTAVSPAISMETTGSIEKPKALLRNYYVSEIHNGYATIDSPNGEFAVAPGDTAPGIGRVLRIERHGHDWVVITTLGQIASVGY